MRDGGQTEEGEGGMEGGGERREEGRKEGKSICI